MSQAFGKCLPQRRNKPRLFLILYLLNSGLAVRNVGSKFYVYTYTYIIVTFSLDPSFLRALPHLQKNKYALQIPSGVQECPYHFSSTVPIPAILQLAFLLPGCAI